MSIHGFMEVRYAESFEAVSKTEVRYAANFEAVSETDSSNIENSGLMICGFSSATHTGFSNLNL